jgi:integrase
VSDLMAALKADLEIRSKWSPQAKTTSEHVTRAFGSMRATSLTAEKVDEYIKDRLAERYAKASINHSLQMLKQSFTLAELPAPKIRRLDTTDNVRTGFFTELEVRRVMSNLEADLSDFVLFGWLTGMRKSEISSLRWQDMTGDEIRLRAENAKTGEGRSIPFEGELAELIERRKKVRKFKIKDVETSSPLIFHRKGDPVCEFRKSWRTACLLAGVGRLHCPKCNEPVDAKRKCAKCATEWKTEDLVYIGRIFHDLRRSAARNMLNAGVPQAIAMQITGHKTDSMFRRYAIVTPKDVRTALRLTQEHTAAEMQEAVAAQAPATVN